MQNCELSDCLHRPGHLNNDLRLNLFEKALLRKIKKKDEVEDIIVRRGVITRAPSVLVGSEYAVVYSLREGIYIISDPVVSTKDTTTSVVGIACIEIEGREIPVSYNATPLALRPTDKEFREYHELLKVKGLLN
jgi:uncharacterized protein YjhX (UPF0386 family)